MVPIRLLLYVISMRGAVEWSDRARWTEFREGKGTGLFRDACRRGDEGIIGKLLSGP